MKCSKASISFFVNIPSFKIIIIKSISTKTVYLKQSVFFMACYTQANWQVITQIVSLLYYYFFEMPVDIPSKAARN